MAKNVLTLSPVKIIHLNQIFHGYNPTMIHLKYRIILLFIIPSLLFNLSTNALFSVAHAVEESGHSTAHKISIFNVDSNDHCPACPDEKPQNTDHSHSSCDHHSSQYIGHQPLLISYNPNISTRSLSEPFNALPEVYLEKFIPPQILA